MEAGVNGADADGGAAECALERAVDAGAEGLQTFAGQGEGLAGIVAEDGGGEVGDTILAFSELGGEGGFQTEGKVVESLGLAVEERGDSGFGAADGDAGEALAGLEELEAGGAFEAVRLIGEVLGDLVLSFSDELGGGGGGWGAEVGGKVGDGEVGFVANGGDDGEFAGDDGAGYALGVEGSEVFERASAAGEDDEIDES